MRLPQFSHFIPATLMERINSITNSNSLAQEGIRRIKRAFYSYLLKGLTNSLTTF